MRNQYEFACLINPILWRSVDVSEVVLRNSVEGNGLQICGGLWDAYSGARRG